LYRADCNSPYPASLCRTGLKTISFVQDEVKYKISHEFDNDNNNENKMIILIIIILIAMIAMIIITIILIIIIPIYRRVRWTQAGSGTARKGPGLHSHLNSPLSTADYK